MSIQTMDTVPGAHALPIALDAAPMQRGSSAAARAFVVEIVTDEKELPKLRDEWTRLEELSGATAVFQSFAQIEVWARHFAHTGASSKLHVAVVREGGRAVLILPLVISGRPPFRIARPAGDPIAQYADILADPAADGEAAFAAALASVQASGVAALIFRKVRADSALHRLGARHFRPGSNPDVAAEADLTPYGSYDAFLHSRSKKMRQGLRNRSNHIGKAGEVSFELMTGAAARDVLDKAISMKRRWLIQRGALSSAFLDPETKACLLDLAECAGCGSVVMRMRVNGETAAIRFGFEYQGTHYAYMSAYDEAFSTLSPGKMLMSFYLSQFRERGIGRLDMLPPTGRHKTDWCAEEVAVADYTLPLGLAGRAFVGLYQERLRPAMKAGWYRLPVGLRSLVTALFVQI